MNRILCRHCNKELEADAHGSARYHRECRKQHKRQLSISKYAATKDVANPIFKNVVILNSYSDILPCELGRSTLTSKGFDFTRHNRTYIDVRRETVFVVGLYEYFYKNENCIMVWIASEGYKYQGQSRLKAALEKKRGNYLDRNRKY